VYLIGAAWSLLLWALPFLDFAFSLPILRSSIEDSRPMALFQSISSTGVYLWPIAITFLSLRSSRFHVADLPRKPGATRAMLVGIAGLVVILAVIGAALLVSSNGLYHAGHTALELMMLLWLLFYRARPNLFLAARKEIEQQHRQRERLEPTETIRIAERLERAVKADRILTKPGLDLPSLARALRLPTYRLSSYFNTVLGVSFPAWLNAARIEYVRRLLAEKPGMSILEVSIEAGYSSKTVFNSQFLRRTGMSPSEYRATLANSGTVSSKQDDKR
jgi:AraC-like DNA-binding protein